MYAKQFYLCMCIFIFTQFYCKELYNKYILSYIFGDYCANEMRFFSDQYMCIQLNKILYNSGNPTLQICHHSKFYEQSVCYVCYILLQASVPTFYQKIIMIL